MTEPTKTLRDEFALLFMEAMVDSAATANNLLADEAMEFRGTASVNYAERACDMLQARKERSHD